MAAQTTGENEAIKRELIEYCVRLAKLVGQPKSVGEIYGLLFASEEALTMEDIIRELGISLGTASQGLKTLRGLQAVRIQYKTGERKDYFAAETDFRRIVSSFLADKVGPHLENGDIMAQRAAEAQKECAKESENFYKERVRILKKLNGTARTAMGLIKPILRF